MAGGNQRGPGWKEKMATVLDLPRELVLRAPRLVLIGNLHLTVENHRGVIEFGPERLVVGMGEGQVTIEGRDLVITRVGREELAVRGHVTCLRFT